MANIIRKVDDYVVQNLGKISVLTAIDKELALKNGEKEQTFWGFTVLLMSDQNRVPIEFPIDVDNINDAVEQFYFFAQKHFNEISSQRIKENESKTGESLGESKNTNDQTEGA